MDKIKFVMTNTSDIVTEVCREALEAKGVTVMVCDKNGHWLLWRPCWPSTPRLAC